MLFTVVEDIGDVLDCVWPLKCSRCEWWSSSKSATSAGVNATDIELSDICAMIGRCAMVGKLHHLSCLSGTCKMRCHRRKS